MSMPIIKKLHIACVLEDGKLGGPQIYILRMAVALKEKIDITIVMPMENSENFRKLCDISGVSYKTFWLSRITKEWKVALRYVLFFPYEICRLALYFFKEKFSLVYVCGGSWQYKGAIAGRLSGSKVVWHLNDSSFPFLFRKIFRSLSPLASGFIYASVRSQEYYESLIKYNLNEFVIPSPVDTARFDPTNNYTISENLYKEIQNKVVIGTVANISPVKGLETMIRSASLLNQDFKNLVFIVIGSISHRQEAYFSELKGLCSELSVDNLLFVGGYTDIRPILKKLDIYICSSLSESSPISVWEAMSMGKPIVSTDVGDVSIYVKHNRNGFIVDVGDERAMSKYISVLIKDKGIKHDFGKISRNTAVNKLDSQFCALHHIKAFNHVLNYDDNDEL